MYSSWKNTVWSIVLGGTFGPSETQQFWISNGLVVGKNLPSILFTKIKFERRNFISIHFTNGGFV